MTRKNIFTIVGFFVAFIFFVNILASKFYLYSSIWYFDLIMHFLGGAWLALFLIWFFYDNFLKQGFSKKNFWKVFLGVLFIGVLWEFFQVFVHDIFSKDEFDFIDSFTDVIADVLGGVFVFLVFKKILK